MSYPALSDAKDRLRIPELWRTLQLPGECTRNPCHSPFYEPASKPSFSVWADGTLFHDFRTGQGGDAISFLQLATGLSIKEAVRKFGELAGGTTAPADRSINSVSTRKPRPLPVLPSMRHGTKAELAQLAELRHVEFDVVKVADMTKMLQFGQWRGQLCWFITDGLHTAQARRMDGLCWEEFGGAKAITLPGSWASWPIGLKQAVHHPYVALCEGGPDFLAALHFA